MRMTVDYGKVNASIVNKLIGVVGENWVSSDPEDLYIYARDMTETKPGAPEAIGILRGHVHQRSWEAGVRQRA